MLAMLTVPGSLRLPLTANFSALVPLTLVTWLRLLYTELVTMLVPEAANCGRAGSRQGRTGSRRCQGRLRRCCWS